MAAGEPQARPLPAPDPAGHPAAPGSTAPAFPLAAGVGSAAPVAADAPTAARLPRAGRRTVDGLTVPLVADAPLEVVGGTVGPGTVPRTLAAPVAAAGIPTTAPASKAPPSRPAPGRKIRPRNLPSRNIPAALRRILPGAAGGPSRPGEALCPLEPATPTAMCRPPVRPTRLHLVRRGQAVPGPIPQGQRPRAALPNPARQERGRTPSPPDPPIPQAAAR